MHIRAVEYAAQHGVPLRVGSSFGEGPGTRIGAADESGRSDALERSSRYRPLVLTVRENAARLRVADPDPAAVSALLPRLLEHLDTTGIITEWLDSGRGLRWEVLGDRKALAPVAAAARDAGAAEVHWEDELTCLSLAGGRPDSWLEVQRQVAEVLAAAGVRDAGLRADGSALRILVPAATPPGLARLLHERLLPR